MLPSQCCSMAVCIRTAGLCELGDSSDQRGLAPPFSRCCFGLTRSNLVQHYKEMDCHRQAVEQVLFDAGVDMIFAGASDLPL